MTLRSLAAICGVLVAGAAVADDFNLDDLRAAVEKYKDVNVALADGYVPDPSGACVSAAAEGLPAELGGMGIHYLHPARLKLTGDAPRVDGESTHTDFMVPAILLYEPQADGTLELVGIENLVFEKAWRAAGNATAPMMNGRMWDHMADDADTPHDEAHGFMPHYDQHVWLFRENPAGEFEPFNANVTCDHLSR
ncbi:hypothetical protein [Tranquillimonas alkanivorans]|uniref:Uncharacterized protein n=1 Tax=Tranquillimonas alkanivorans TaxID=441119 RepID=A0A1I5TBS1_9RHOB|nr:hypothetical protein [Tranquillimonas alkanivorans]SFP80107.1 hypothetical protein SAMN04488047_11319 [Tranquillimonas alkanivorans]